MYIVSQSSLEGVFNYLFQSSNESLVSFLSYILSQSFSIICFNLPLNHKCPLPRTLCHQGSSIIFLNLPSNHTCLRTLCPFGSLFYSLNLPLNHKCPLPRTLCHRALQSVSLCPSSVGAQKCQGAGVDDMI